MGPMGCICNDIAEGDKAIFYVKEGRKNYSSLAASKADRDVIASGWGNDWIFD